MAAYASRIGRHSWKRREASAVLVALAVLLIPVEPVIPVALVVLPMLVVLTELVVLIALTALTVLPVWVALAALVVLPALTVVACALTADGIEAVFHGLRALTPHLFDLLHGTAHLLFGHHKQRERPHHRQTRDRDTAEGRHAPGFGFEHCFHLFLGFWIVCGKPPGFMRLCGKAKTARQQAASPTQKSEVHSVQKSVPRLDKTANKR